MMRAGFSAARKSGIATRRPLQWRCMLDVIDLSIDFRTDDGPLRAVDGVCLQLAPGEKLGLVGESGCGKSTLSLALMRLLEPQHYAGGAIVFEDEDILAMDDRRMRRLRGGRIAMIFQDAAAALHPMLPVGVQIAEVLQAHAKLSRRAAMARAVDLLASVGIPDAARRAKAYPHELSGGMCQRVMIAGAIACDPRLIIADEPTTALDVTVQAQILDLMNDVCDRTGSSVLLITHDLGVVAGMCDRVAVMYAGRIVESAPTEALFARPLHPYTLGLLNSAPRMDAFIGADLVTIPGSVGSSRDVAGCKFAPRCHLARPVCWDRAPPLETKARNHLAACWFSAELAAPSTVASAPA